MIEKTCGYKLETENGITYCGSATFNGECYKDLSAWESGEGVIYISEYQLIDLEEGIVEEHELWTKQTWFDWVKNEVNECLSTEVSDEFIEYLAFDILMNADWQDLTTLFIEYDYNSNYIEDNYLEWILTK